MATPKTSTGSDLDSAALELAQAMREGLENRRTLGVQPLEESLAASFTPDARHGEPKWAEAATCHRSSEPASRQYPFFALRLRSRASPRTAKSTSATMPTGWRHFMPMRFSY